LAINRETSAGGIVLATTDRAGLRLTWP